MSEFPVVLEIADEISSLTLSICEKLEVPECYDGVQLHAQVHSKGFSGENGSAWVFRHELLEFAEALHLLGSTSTGKALLASHSPEDLRLQVEPSGSLGHMVATGFVGLTFLGHTDWCTNRIELSMELDPTTLGAIGKHIQRCANAA